MFHNVAFQMQKAPLLLLFVLCLLDVHVKSHFLEAGQGNAPRKSWKGREEAKGGASLC